MTIIRYDRVILDQIDFTRKGYFDSKIEKRKYQLDKPKIFAFQSTDQK